MFEDLVELFAQHGSIKFTQEKDSLWVSPSGPNRYEAGIQQITPERYVVWLGAWHEVFDDYPTARSCFLFGLSDRCRVKVFRKGNVAFRWVLEHRNDTEWITASTTGLLFLFYPFWRRTTIEYLTNDSLTE